MTVHHRGALKAGLVTALAMLAIIGYRAWRVDRAERVEGRVQLVEATNGRCKGKKSRPCTYFYAFVAYQVDGTTYRLRQPAGWAFRDDQPVSQASLEVGDTVSVAFDPKDPAYHYNDRWKVAPKFVLGVLGVGVVLVIVGLRRPTADRVPSRGGGPVEPQKRSAGHAGRVGPSPIHVLNRGGRAVKSPLDG